MRLVNIDLTNIVAIGHENGKLALLIDRGDEMEYLQIPAPSAAFDGLQQIAEIANDDEEHHYDDYDDYNIYDDEEIDLHEEEVSMLPVNSSMASAIGYNEQQKTLQIEFNSGSVYQYSNVEIETWERLQEADSTGRFYNKEIKGHYSCQRLDDDTFSETYRVVYSEHYPGDFQP